MKYDYAVRQDAAYPGSMKCQVVLDDGPDAGRTIATCEYEEDAKCVVERWNLALDKEAGK